MVHDPQSNADEPTQSPGVAENPGGGTTDSDSSEVEANSELTSNDLRGVAGGWSGQDQDP